VVCHCNDDKAWVKDGPGSHRVVSARTPRSDQAIGAFVCLTKRNDDVRCGFIQEKSYQPTIHHNPTFIRVDGTMDLSEMHDSGGPWWAPTANALGIHRGHWPEDLSQGTYMAQNFVSAINRRVKINPPG
jgi:hypothetical protein